MNGLISIKHFAQHQTMSESLAGFLTILHANDQSYLCTQIPSRKHWRLNLAQNFEILCSAHSHQLSKSCGSSAKSFKNEFALRPFCAVFLSIRVFFVFYFNLGKKGIFLCSNWEMTIAARAFFLHFSAILKFPKKKKTINIRH